MPRRWSGSAAVPTYLGLPWDQVDVKLRRLRGALRRSQNGNSTAAQPTVIAEVPAAGYAVLPGHLGVSPRAFALSLHGPSVPGSGLSDGTRECAA
jgi:hypothetical protein